MTGEGIDELRAFLNEDVPKLSLEEAKFRQSLGLNEWDPPVSYTHLKREREDF